MTERQIYSIFKKGSRTYFYNSLFFPRDIKDDVFVLYSFVRKADDYVDSVPQMRDEYFAFKDRFGRAMTGEVTGDLVADSFAELHRRKGFDPGWTRAFFASMEMDLRGARYRTIPALEKYIYGSAEVIGLYMASIMGLDKAAYPHARHLGKAMQLINFIRDVDEDLSMGRQYLPVDLMEEHGLRSLEQGEAERKPLEFRAFVRRCIGTYVDWQTTAEAGYRFMPRRHLIPVKNASEMYKWTARTIHRDPFVVFDRKVKPSIPRIVFGIGLKSVFRPEKTGNWERDMRYGKVSEGVAAE